MKALHIYILHAKALKDREISISNIVTKLKSYIYKNITIGDVYIMASNDPDSIPIDFIQKSIDYSMINDAKLKVYNQFLKNIHVNQLSNTLKHVDSLNKIIQKQNDDLHLVIEDDVLFSDNVCEAIDSVIGDIKDQPIIFLGLPSNVHPDQPIGIIPSTFPIVPVVDSYIIKYNTAKLLCDNFFPIKFTAVFQLNYLLNKLDIEVFQTNKNVFVNGSKYGMFVSSLNPNNALIFNKDYVTVLEIINKEQNTLEEDLIIRRLAKESPISTSPDFMYLIAKYTIKEKKYKEAEKLLSDSYNLILAKNGIVNHESSILKDFIRIFKHLQSF